MVEKGVGNAMDDRIKAIPNIAAPEKFGKGESRVFLPETMDSEFVEIQNNGHHETGNFIEVAMQYPILGMKNAEKKCYVRKEVYERLISAAKMLPAGYQLKILDAWRPFALQQELYTTYSDRIVKEFGLSGYSEDKQRSVIRKYVSEPIEDRELPPVHTTGGAVDLTIIGKDGKELEMGTDFDAFTDKTNTSYFETGENIEIRDNRRLLYHVMTKAGFTNLPSEWWHFDYGDHFWAYYTHQPALYRGVFTKEEIPAI